MQLTASELLPAPTHQSLSALPTPFSRPIRFPVTRPLIRLYCWFAACWCELTLPLTGSHTGIVAEAKLPITTQSEHTGGEPSHRIAGCMWQHPNHPDPLLWCGRP